MSFPLKTLADSTMLLSRLTRCVQAANLLRALRQSRDAGALGLVEGQLQPGKEGNDIEVTTSLDPMLVRRIHSLQRFLLGQLHRESSPEAAAASPAASPAKAPGQVPPPLQSGPSHGTGSRESARSAQSQLTQANFLRANDLALTVNLTVNLALTVVSCAISQHLRQLVTQLPPSLQRQLEAEVGKVSLGFQWHGDSVAWQLPNVSQTERGSVSDS